MNISLNTTTQGHIYSKVELADRLKKNILKITFTKKDGTERVMPCTLKAELLPEVQDTGEPKKEKKQNDSVIAVWDMEKEAWRSMIIANILSIEEV